MKTDFAKHTTINNTSFEKLSLGTAALGGVWGPVSKAASIETLLYALENGIQSFDSAPAYGDAEEILGAALRQWKGPKPFISTKAGRLKSFDAGISAYDFSPDGIQRSVENSLKILGIEALDVLFLHDPSYVKKHEWKHAVNTLHDLKAQGLTKAIGLGGNIETDLYSIVSDMQVDVFMGYNRFNVVCQDALQNEYIFFQQQKTQLWQASPLYNGLLGSKFELYKKERMPWIPKEHLEKAIALSKYCDKNNFTLPELSIRFMHSNSSVSKVVMGASNVEELSTTLAYWNKGPLPQKAINFINAV